MLRPRELLYFLHFSLTHGLPDFLFFFSSRAKCVPLVVTQKYKPFKGVKYLTRSGQFEVRTWSTIGFGDKMEMQFVRISVDELEVITLYFGRNILTCLSPRLWLWLYLLVLSCSVDLVIPVCWSKICHANLSRKSMNRTYFNFSSFSRGGHVQRIFIWILVENDYGRNTIGGSNFVVQYSLKLFRSRRRSISR